MTLWAAIAATVGAVTGLAALRAAFVEAKRRRLTEIVDLLTDIKAAIDWGSQAAVRRDELQGRLRTRIVGLGLSRTRELAHAQLRSETPFSDLAGEAILETRRALDGLHTFRRRSR